MKDLESALFAPKTILKFAGRWPQHSPTILSRLQEIAFNIFEIFMNILLTVDTIIVLNDFNFDELFDMLAAIIPATGHLFKIVLMKMQKEIWLDILEQLKSKHFNVYPKEFSCVHDKPVNLAKNIGNLFLLGCCCSTTLYILVPLFSDNELPIRCAYVSQEYLAFMYILQSFGIVFCSMTHASIDVLATNLIGISIGQLNVLIEKIQMFGTKNREEKMDLVECVEHHIEIIRFVDKLNEAASGIILVEYFKSVLLVCFLGIQGVHTDPWSLAFARISVYGVVMMLQLALYCIFANEILDKICIVKFLLVRIYLLKGYKMEKQNKMKYNRDRNYTKCATVIRKPELDKHLKQSTQVGDACYHSMWLDADKKDKKSLFIIMERSKIPLFLTAGKFSIVSLQSFTTIMKSSYSYFTLMQTLYAKNEN